MLGGGGGRRFLWLRSRSRHAEPEIFDLNASAFTQNLLVEELSRRTTTGEAMIWKLEGNKQLENCTSSWFERRSITHRFCVAQMRTMDADST